jgi:ATP-binding protein involved in chromosome partitioning
MAFDVKLKGFVVLTNKKLATYLNTLAHPRLPEQAIGPFVESLQITDQTVLILLADDPTDPQFDDGDLQLIQQHLEAHFELKQVKLLKTNPVSKKIKAIVAVASGKGGVGKSTTAVNLAYGLQALGYKVGLLDGDIYGPSLPHMFGISHKPEADETLKKLKPHQVNGLKMMSIGSLVDTTQPTIWRGPMATSALMQLYQDVLWGELDVLLIDLPPGTGDIHLTLMQKIPLDGGIIVSTPQSLALLDAHKAYAMFKKLDKPVLGLVENMTTFVCPHCHTESHIFDHGGARARAEDLGVPFLGGIPLDPALRDCGDRGVAFVQENPDHPVAQAYKNMATMLVKSLGLG